MAENVIPTKIRTTINVDVSAKFRENIMYVNKNIWNPCTYTCENDKYLESILGDSVITCDEIIEVTKAVPTTTISAKTTSTKGISTDF